MNYPSVYSFIPQRTVPELVIFDDTKEERTVCFLEEGNTHFRDWMTPCVIVIDIVHVKIDVYNILKMVLYLKKLDIPPEVVLIKFSFKFP